MMISMRTKKKCFVADKPGFLLDSDYRHYPDLLEGKEEEKSHVSFSTKSSRESVGDKET
jgi:hypothetical protein